MCVTGSPDDHYKRMPRVRVGVARLRTPTAQWQWVSSIGQNLQLLTGNGNVSIWMKNSRVGRKNPVLSLITLKLYRNIDFMEHINLTYIRNSQVFKYLNIFNIYYLNTCYPHNSWKRDSLFLKNRDLCFSLIIEMI